MWTATKQAGAEKKPVPKSRGKPVKKTAAKKAKAVRLGRQTPTTSLVLPYEKSSGQEAIDLYGKTGRTAQEWQELLLYDILAENEDGLWVHTKFGYSVPRRNGKNEVVSMRELRGLAHGEHILHTAHRTTTSHAAWERLCTLLDKSGVAYNSIRATGRESIEVEGGGRCEFRTRSSKGDLGDLVNTVAGKPIEDTKTAGASWNTSPAAKPKPCGATATKPSSERRKRQKRRGLKSTTP